MKHQSDPHVILTGEAAEQFRQLMRWAGRIRIGYPSPAGRELEKLVAVLDKQGIVFEEYS